MRKYHDLWTRLAKNEAVTIVCPRAGEPSIRIALYNEKYKINKMRSRADLPGFGRLNIVSSPVEGKPTHIRLTIGITFSGDNL